MKVSHIIIIRLIRKAEKNQISITIVTTYSFTNQAKKSYSSNVSLNSITYSFILFSLFIVLHLHLDDCLHSPCLNGGTCVDGIANYTCYCPSGFIGKNCATNVDDCSSSPCHHGKCVDEINGFKCLCDPGYTG